MKPVGSGVLVVGGRNETPTLKPASVRPGDSEEAKFFTLKRLRGAGLEEEFQAFKMRLQRYLKKELRLSANDARERSWERVREYPRYFPPYEMPVSELPPLAEPNEPIPQITPKHTEPARAVVEGGAPPVSSPQKSSARVKNLLALAEDGGEAGGAAGGEEKPAAGQTASLAEFDELSFTSDDYRADVLWAYHNYETQRTKPPSPGAVAVLNWAKENRAAFFKDVVPRYLSKKADDDQAELLVVERKSIEQLRQKLKQAVEDGMNEAFPNEFSSNDFLVTDTAEVVLAH